MSKASKNDMQEFDIQTYDDVTVLRRYKGSGGEVVIPDGVTDILGFAFSGCEGLSSVTIPASVKNIRTLAFTGCKNLARFIVDEGNTDFLSDDDGILFSKDRSVLVSVPGGISGTYEIPNSVTTIGGSAFEGCKKIAEVTIPSSVRSIQTGAFNGCAKLTAIRMENGIVSIGHSAFSSCWALTTVTIPDSVTEIGEGAFDFCGELTSITFGTGVITMGKNVFAYSNSIEKITMPASMGSFVSKQFQFSEKLRIDIPDISALPAKFRICAALCYAEDGCDSSDPRYENHVKYLKANAGKIRETAVQNLPLLTLLCREGCINAKDIETYIADVQKTGNTEAIAMVLEYQNSRLTKKQKENTANQKERQENTVFDRMVARTNREGISGLNFVVTGDVRTFEKRSDLKAFIESHGAKLQSAMSSKTDYLIMNDDSSNSEKAQKAKTLGIEVITERKFNDMAGRSLVIEDGVLTHYRGEGGEIIIPDGVTVIGKSSFKDCNGLTSVKIPDGVTTIDERAFQGCKLLSDAKLPASVTTLGIGAFYGCESLTNFTIPDTVIAIGAKAFSGCTGLADDNGFLIVRNVLVGYFGKECEITIPDGVTEIEQRAFFADCNHLVSVIIPDSVKIIGGYAFSCLDQLTSVTIGNGIEAIGIRAFSACEKLTTVSIPNKPIYIEDSAFISSEQVQFQKRSI